MKFNRIYQLFILLALFGGVSGLNAQDGYQLPEYERFKLGNGCVVLLMEQHEVPLINVEVAFPAGAIYDGDKKGLSSMCSDALLFGAGNYSKSELEEESDFLGASLSAFSGMEAGRVSASFAVKDQDKMMEMLAAVLSKPRFDEAEFEKAKARRLQELAQNKESPRSVMSNYWNAFLYGDHPYGNPSSGTRPTVKALSRDDIVKFHQQNYQPGRAVMAVVGDFKTRDMKKYLKKLFSDWEGQKSSIPSVKTPKLKAQNKVLLVDKADSRETRFLIGGKGLKRGSKDMVGIMVVNTVLGGRFTSWLNDALRVNSGLTYGARSSFLSNSLAGTFAISSFTQTSTTIEAIDMALDVLDSLHTHGINKETLESAKAYIKGGFPPRYETASSLARLLCDTWLLDLDPDFINEFEEKVNAIDEASARDLIKQYFPKKKLQFVLIGKADEIRNKVKKYGPIEEKKIEATGF